MFTILGLLFLKTFAGFFAVMDPIGAVPIFIGMTTNDSNDERRKTIRRAVITATLILFFFAATQLWLFKFFGFTLGAFRVAGGLFLFIVAYSMLTAHADGTRQSPEERNEGREKDDISIIPLAIPLLAGPAMIANVVLAFSQTDSIVEWSTVAMALLACSIVTWLILLSSESIGKLLGKSGIKVVTRLMGLILAAMAIQFTADGLIALFPILAK